MKTIAIIDDDIYIGDMLSEVLKKEGYGVLRAYSGTEALYLLEEKTPDLILLDLMLPGISGEKLLHEIKGVPVIILSAKADVRGKVELLMGGAVDYITKPFDKRELLARIAVQLRGSALGAESEKLICGDIELNSISHEVFVQGEPIKLTKTEFAILKQLMLHSGQTLAKSVILERISQDTPDCVESSLKVHISNLRRKLREAGDKDYIEAVWGIGFKLGND